MSDIGKLISAASYNPRCYELAAQFLVTDDKFVVLDRERQRELTDRVANVIQSAIEAELRQICALLESKNDLEKST